MFWFNFMMVKEKYVLLYYGLDSQRFWSIKWAMLRSWMARFDGTLKFLLHGKIVDARICCCSWDLRDYSQKIHYITKVFHKPFMLLPFNMKYCASKLIILSTHSAFSVIFFHYFCMRDWKWMKRKICAFNKLSER